MNAVVHRLPRELLAEEALIAAGDVVRTGENFHPHYHVIAVTQDRAWVRDTQHGSDHVVPIERCHKI